MAAIRIACHRGGNVFTGLLEGIASHFVPSGLRSRSRERPPMRIVPAGSGVGDGAPMRCAEGDFDLLQPGTRRLQAFIPARALPRPWRHTAECLEAEFLMDRSGIDWHIDPTSGFRWDPRVRSTTIRYANQPGVEVKWPWEIGRLQHLPAIALGAAGSGDDHVAWAADLIQQNVADFIRCNPPGFGVQWICPMDVGIRIANLLVAVDLARAAGADFSPAFLRLVSATARDHARYIARHLEWSDRLCSNHYLANAAGLLFVGAYLGDDAEASEWLAFAGREMVHQIRYQFHEEGSNFEGSSCYHRLSAEMAIHAAALMLWICRHRPKAAQRWWSGSVRNFHPSPAAPATASVPWIQGLRHPFDDGILHRLAGMGRFTASLLRSDGAIPQVGDNDNGRFMRLEMSADPMADIDDHRHLIRACSALFGSAPPGAGRESDWMAAWLGEATLPMPEPPVGQAGAWHEFGLFVWRTPRLRITLRCGHVGQLGNGGHAHCDQLSITLSTPAGPIIDDPGTGVYTPQPDVRNQLRSSTCHSTVLVPGREQGDWLPGRWGLFSLKDLAKARLIELSDGGATAEMFDGADLVRRTLEITDCGVRVVDSAPLGSIANFVLAPGVGVEVIGQDCALLRCGELTVRFRGEALRVNECSWSTRYGDVSRTRRIQCSAKVCEFELG